MFVTTTALGALLAPTVSDENDTVVGETPSIDCAATSWLMKGSHVKRANVRSWRIGPLRLRLDAVA